MRVQELSKEELLELKSSLYYELNESGKSDEILGDIEYFAEIPNEMVFERYDGVDFVSEDFFCDC